MIDNERIVILGHKNPDVDSIISGYLLTSYLRYKRYNVEYVIPDSKVDEEVVKILNNFGINIENFSGNILKDDKLILVDHYETVFNNEVIAVIDHHPTIREFNYPIYINRKYPSTTKLVYDLINKENSKYVSCRFIELVLVGLAVDTCSFRSSKSTKEDKEWFFAMCDKYELDKDFILSVGDCITDLTDLYKASTHGYKSYNYFGKDISTSYIQVYDISEEELEAIINNIKDNLMKNSLRMWVFIYINLKELKSKVYKIEKNSIEVLEYDFMVSRAVDIMPKIEKEMKKEC